MRRLVCEFYDGFSFGKFIKAYVEMKIFKNDPFAVLDQEHAVTTDAGIQQCALNRSAILDRCAPCDCVWEAYLYKYAGTKD